MRFGFLPGRIFFGAWWRAFFQGVFAKNGVLVWCICGEVVVDCVVNRGALMDAFLASKNVPLFWILFWLDFLTLFLLISL
jgi:hypothetical protein